MKNQILYFRLYFVALFRYYIVGTHFSFQELLLPFQLFSVLCCSHLALLFFYFLLVILDLAFHLPQAIFFGVNYLLKVALDAVNALLHACFHPLHFTLQVILLVFQRVYLLVEVWDRHRGQVVQRRRHRSGLAQEVVAFLRKSHDLLLLRSRVALQHTQLLLRVGELVLVELLLVPLLSYLVFLISDNLLELLLLLLNFLEDISQLGLLLGFESAL